MSARDSRAKADPGHERHGRSPVIEDLRSRLISGYAPEKIILFGSYAYGRPGRDSDIDLLIIKQTAENFLDRWMTVQRLLNGLHRSIPLEALVMTPDEINQRLLAGDQFLKEILAKGEVLYDQG
jgi:predicted nucleotidyltransferase